MKLLCIRHRWPEKAGFAVDRPDGTDSYTFLHFYTPVLLLGKSGPVSARPGASILYAPGSPQYFFSEQRLEHDWMHFTATKSELAELSFRCDTVYYPGNPDWISRQFFRAEQEMAENRKHRESLLTNYLREFLLLLDRMLTAEKSTHIPGETEGALRKLRRQMAAFPEKPFSAEAQAAEIGFSLSRFYALYRELFDSSPREDLIRFRIQKAEDLLSGTHLSVAEIAELLGYAEPTHFIRQFHDRTGLNPTAFRKNSFKPPREELS